MPDYTIEQSDVSQSATSHSNIAALIVWADGADACLAANAVDEDFGKWLKVEAIHHVLELATGGAVSSRRSIDGASISYAMTKGNAYGTTHGQMIAQMDKHGCVLALISNNSPVQLRAVGRYSE